MCAQNAHYSSIEYKGIRKTRKGKQRLRCSSFILFGVLFICAYLVIYWPLSDYASLIYFRVGHTWIPRAMEIFSRNRQRVQRVPTENTFLRPDLTYRPDNPPPPGLEGLAYWLSGDPSPETDRYVIKIFILVKKECRISVS